MSQKHLDKIKRGSKIWNNWRKDNPDIIPDLCGVDLSGVDFRGVNLYRVNFRGSDLSQAIF